MFNNEAEYAGSRLVNSYVKAREHDHGIVRVSSIENPSGNGRLSDSLIVGTNKKLQKVKLRPDDIFFSPGKLGYVNGNFESTRYVSRMPIRRDYKQGLRPGQLIVHSGLNSYNAMSEHSFSSVDFLGSLADCLHDRYPGYYAGLELVEETGLTVALSRHFAVNSSGDLLYRATKVGKLKGDERLSLASKFNFLEEELSMEIGDGFLARL